MGIIFLKWGQQFIIFPNVMYSWLQFKNELRVCVTSNCIFAFSMFLYKPWLCCLFMLCTSVTPQVWQKPEHRIHAYYTTSFPIGVNKGYHDILHKNSNSFWALKPHYQITTGTIMMSEPTKTTTNYKLYILQGVQFLSLCGTD